MSMKDVVIDGVRYVPEVDPLAEVKAAHKAGKPIEYRHTVDSPWFTPLNQAGLGFCNAPELYRIKIL